MPNLPAAIKRQEQTRLEAFELQQRALAQAIPAAALARQQYVKQAKQSLTKINVRLNKFAEQGLDIGERELLVKLLVQLGEFSHGLKMIEHVHSILTNGGPIGMLPDTMDAIGKGNICVDGENVELASGKAKIAADDWRWKIENFALYFNPQHFVDGKPSVELINEFNHFLDRMLLGKPKKEWYQASDTPADKHFTILINILPGLKTLGVVGPNYAADPIVLIKGIDDVPLRVFAIQRAVPPYPFALPGGMMGNIKSVLADIATLEKQLAVPQLADQDQLERELLDLKNQLANLVMTTFRTELIEEAFSGALGAKKNIKLNAEIENANTAADFRQCVDHLLEKIQLPADAKKSIQECLSLPRCNMSIIDRLQTITRLLTDCKNTNPELATVITQILTEIRVDIFRKTKISVEFEKYLNEQVTVLPSRAVGPDNRNGGKAEMHTYPCYLFVGQDFFEELEQRTGLQLAAGDDALKVKKLKLSEFATGFVSHFDLCLQSIGMAVRTEQYVPTNIDLVDWALAANILVAKAEALEKMITPQAAVASDVSAAASVRMFPCPTAAESASGGLSTSSATDESANKRVSRRITRTSTE